MSIRLKLAILFLSLVSIPLVIISLITFTSYQKSLEIVRLAQIQDIARFKADKIEMYFLQLREGMELTQTFYNIRKNLPVLARSANIHNDPAALEARKILDLQMERTRKVLGLADIMLAKNDGTIVYVSDTEYRLNKLLQPLANIWPTSSRLLADTLCISDIFQNTIAGNKLQMLATAPVADLAGTKAGTIVFEIDMAPLYALIQDTAGLGRTGEILVCKKTDDTIVYLNPLRHDTSAILKHRVPFGTQIAIPAQNALAGKTGVGRSTDYRGIDVIAAWRNIPSLGWGLVAKIDSREAFESSTRQRRLVFAILAALFALSAVVTFFFTRSISRPIRALSLGAQIIGSGNLDYKVGTAARDEIGQLSRAFDTMTHELKSILASRSELNREIAQRTRIQAESQRLDAQLQERMTELHKTNGELQSSRRAALNIMDDAVMERRKAETISNELSRLNQSFKALGRSGHAMVRAQDESTYLKEVCSIIIKECGHAMVWIGFAQDDVHKSVRPMAHSGFDESYIESLNITWDDSPRGRGPTGNAIRTGTICVCKNMLTDPQFEPWREHAISNGYASSVVFPLIAAQKVFGTMSVYSRIPDSFTQDEIQLLSEIANDLAQGITAIRQRLELAHKAEKLAAANKELEAFSYSVSHDLRAPIRAIKAFSNILIEDHTAQLDPQGLGYLDRIISGTDRVSALINNMLDLSQISRRDVELTDVDMSTIARMVADELRQTEPGRDVTVTIAQGLRARADERLINTLIANLIGNAWKYTGKTSQARIEFGTNTECAEPVYFVRDNGVGFDMAQYNRLFTPFQRLHSEQQFPGTGIGLALVAKVIQRHGGRIWGEGEIDNGATFYFTLNPERC